MTFQAEEGESKIYCPFIPKSVMGKCSDDKCKIDYQVEMTCERAANVFLKVKPSETLTVVIRG